MKRFLISVLLFLIPIMFVHANTISNINMDIYVDSNGNATITETWNSYVDSGTEGYHPYYNIDSSNIEVISAKMDNEEYTVTSTWDINQDISKKAYKVGIYKTGSETDICFGLSKYGNHVYEVKYKITNFVLSTTDSDIIYWQLFPYNFSTTPDQIYIKIYSDFKYEDTLDVWGYGNYGGYAYVYDGYIEMLSSDDFDSSDYMTILVKFSKNTFTTDNVSDNDFNYYYEMAEEGSKKYSEKDNVRVILFFILFPIIMILIFLINSKFISNGNRYSFGKTGNKVRKDVPNYRDIPCNKDLFNAYFISNLYKLNKKKEDLLGAVLLKWLNKGYVKVEKYESKKLFKTETLNNIVFNNSEDYVNVMNPLEYKLYTWMYEASKDGKLEENEFKNWSSRNYNKLFNWFNEIIDYEKDKLISENKITIEEIKKGFLKSKEYVVNPCLMEEAEKLQGLKNYLKDFTLIKEKEPIEVKLWGEYLIYAQIFGMAKEVASQFKKLYPEIVTEMNTIGFNYDDIIFINNISTSGISSASIARSRAESYSSGGGGFSSGGGGGGSFGGGGGGGGFR